MNRVILAEDDTARLYATFKDFLDLYHKNEQHVTNQPLTVELVDLFSFFIIDEHIEDKLFRCHDDTHAIFVRAVEDWCGAKRDINYSTRKRSADNDTVKTPFNTFNDINHLNENCMLRIKATIESYSDYLSVPIMYRFDCPSCGNVMHHKKLKILPCKCGRKQVRYTDRELHSRTFFTLLEKIDDKGNLGSAPSVAQCYYTITTDMPDTPLFHRGLVGKEVDALCVVRGVDTIKNLKDEVHWVLELRGLQPLNEYEISDAQREHVLKTITEREDKMQLLYDLATSMRENVAYQDDYSLVCLIAAVGVHAGDPDLAQINQAINVLFVGDPSGGKTYITRQILKYIPNGHWHSGRQNEKALLGATPAVSGMGDRNFVVKVGLFKIADGGYLFFDELDKLAKFAPQVVASIYTAIGDGHHTVDTAFAKLTFKYRTNVIGLANFKNITHDPSNKSKYSQIDIETGILRRMDAVIIYKNFYEDEFGIVNDEKYKEFVAIQSGRIIPKRVFSQEFCKLYGIAVSQYQQGQFTEDALRKIEETVRRRRQEAAMAYDEDARHNLEKKPVDNRYLNTLKRWSKTISRLLFAERTEPEHVEIADHLLDKVQFSELMRRGISSLLEFENIQDQQKVRIVTQKNAKEAVLDSFEIAKTYEGDEILEKLMEKGFGRAESERIFAAWYQIGEFSEVRRGIFQKQ